MAKLMKVLAANTDDLGLIPEPIQQKKRTDSCNLSSDVHMYTMGHVNHTHKINKSNKVTI